MYRHFFGLRESPFGVNPDPRYLFLTRQTREALDKLSYGIQTRQGLTLLTGEVGTGKTTLINRLLDWLHQQRTPTAFIFNPRLETRQLFDFMLAEFGVPFETRTDNNPLMRLNEWLLERYRGDKNAVLIVDEAQGLSFDLLEEIRLLLNLETAQEKLLQIVLVGQPELEETLKRYELRQLQQRIAHRCKTAPLTSEETRAYIQARLQIAGSDGRVVFAPEAINALHYYARGVPRVINLLSEHSLINAYVDDLQPIPAKIVDEVAHEFQFDDAKRPVSPATFGIAADCQSIPMKSILAEATAPPPSAAEPSFETQSTRRLALQSQTITSPLPLRLIGSRSDFDLPANAQSGSDSLPETSEPHVTTNSRTAQTLRPFAEREIRKLRAWPIHRRAWWIVRWLSITLSPRRTQIISTFLWRLRLLMNPVRSMHRRWTEWRHRMSPIVHSMAVPRMAASVIRWLQEPFGQMPKRLPHSRTAQVAGQFNHKKEQFH
jgi:general secretion pathway protein A